MNNFVEYSHGENVLKKGRIPLHMVLNKDMMIILSSALSPRVISKKIASNRIKMLATAANYVRDIEVRTGLILD